MRIHPIACFFAASFIAAARADEPVLRDVAGTTLRLLPAGRFEMGATDLASGFYKDHSEFNSADDERPVHPVVLTKPFYIAATEVTVGQFRRFVQETGYVTTAEKNKLGAVGWDPTPPENNPRFVATFRQKPEFTWKTTGFPQEETHPVVGVSFEDARAYCAWLSKKENANYRLPTEAEWEYAARAGTTTWFSFGDDYHGVIQRHANLGNVELEKAFPDRVRRQWVVDIERDPPDRHVFTAPVGSYEANPWKLHDLAGNVWEWCEDRYLDTYYNQFSRPAFQQVRRRAVDPLNTERANDAGDWRIIRGGSWFNAPIQCRPNHRSYFEASDAASHIGFRVVRVASAEAVANAKQQFEKSEAARAAIDAAAGGFREVRDGRLTLRLSINQVDEPLLDHLSRLEDPLDLSVECQFKLTPELFAAFLKTPQLRGLSLSNMGPKLTDADCLALAKLPQLELLQLRGTPTLSDAMLKALVGMTSLEQLSLQGDGITDAGLELLPALPRLKQLSLNGTQSTGAILKRLKGSPLDNASFDHLTDHHASAWKAFPTLRSIQLSGSPIGGATIAAIASLPRVTSIELQQCSRLKDEDLASLSACYPLQRLNLEKTAAGDRAASALAGLNNLSDLRFGSPQLTVAGMRSVCEIVSLRQLAVSVEATALTDAGLSDLWRLANLSYLESMAPQITGAGLSSLRELSELRTLTIGSPELTDAALREIARCDALTQLTIGGYQSPGAPSLTDEGLQILSTPRALKQLTLFRKNTNISDAGIDALKNTRPALAVTVR